MNDSIRNYKEYGFDKMPFLSREYENQYFKLILAQEKINNRLKDYEDFGGVCFSDVHAGGIQIHMNNKRVPICIADSTIKYDFSNIDEAVEKAIQAFIDTDNEQSIKNANDFYEDGCKYGWD